MVYQIRLVPLQGMVELEVTHRVGSKFLKVMFLPFLWVEPVQTELEVTTVVEMVVITFTVPEGELLISALVGYWKDHPAELQAFRQFQARGSSAKNSPPPGS